MAKRPVDEKIVAMKLDNSDLKAKAAETTTIFGKLKSSLGTIKDISLGKLESQFGGLQKSANSVNMDSLANSVDQVAGRFTTLGVIATTALVNITNRAVDAGLALSKSLTTDQVKGGFAEYELKMKSIQTILANTQSKGSTLEDVKRNLEDLNKYADRTIYSFGEMTKNIGLFTNAGLELDESTAMIEGFSNAAAASGAGAIEAARAAYQLSQGLSQGYIMTMDWMSLTNAGMGNDNMKRDLIAIAQAMGTLDRTTEDTLKNWKESLTDDKWLTSNVMSNYLRIMSGDIDKATMMANGLTEKQAEILLLNAKTGAEAATKVRTFTQMMDTLKEGIGSSWAETWEIIFGDFEDATVFWTKISEAIGKPFEKMGENRNNLLRAIIGDSGLTGVLDNISNLLKPIGQVLGAIGDAWKTAFPPAPTERIQSLASKLSDLIKSLALSETTVENIKSVFTGLFSVLAIGWEAFKSLGSVVVKLLPGFEKLGAGAMDLLGDLFKIPTKLKEFVTSGDGLSDTTTVLGKAFSVLSTIIGGVGVVLSNTSGTLSQLWNIMTKGSLVDGPIKEGSMVAGILFEIRDSAAVVLEYLSQLDISGMIKGIFDGVGSGWEGIKNIFTNIKDFFTNLPQIISENQGYILAGGGLAGLVAIGWKLWEFFNGFSKPLSRVGEILDNTGDALEAFTLNIHVKSLLTIAIAVGILAVSLTLLANLNAAQIAGGLTTIVIALSAMVGALWLISSKDITGSFGATLSIVGLAAALVLVAGAMRIMAGLNPQEITKGVITLVAVLGTLTGAVVLMGKYGDGQIGASALQFIAIGVAVHILVSAIKKIAEIPVGELTKGMITLSAILLVLSAFVTSLGNNPLTLGSAVGVLAIAGALNLIVFAVKSLGEMDIGILKQGMITIGLILGAFAGLATLTSNKGLLSTGAGILILAVAINALVIPLAAFGAMSWETIGKGLLVIGTLMLTMAGLSALASGMIRTSVAVGIMAAALNLLVIPIAALGSMPFENVIKGIAGLAIGLLAMGGVLALLGLAAPTLLAAAVAIGILGIAAMAAGVGMSLFAKGLILLAGLGSGAVITIVATISALITGFVSLLPAITDLSLKVLNSMINVFATMMPKIIDTVGNYVLMLLDKLTEFLPQIVTKISELLLLMLNKYEEFLPQFIQAGADVIVAYITGMTTHIPRIVQAITELIIAMVEQFYYSIYQFSESGANILIAFLEGMTTWVPNIVSAITDLIIAIMDELANSVNKFVAAGVANIVAFLEGLSSEMPKVVDAMAQFVIDMINGMTNVIETRGPEFTDAIMRLMSEVVVLIVDAGLKVIDALFGWIPGVSKVTETIGKTAGEYIRDNFKAEDIANEKGEEFATTLSGTEDLAKTAGELIANAGKDGADSVKMDTVGEDFGIGFANGISSKGIIGKVKSAGVALANAAYNAVKTKLDINSPSREMWKLGEFTGEGFSEGTKSKAKSAKKSGNTVGKSAGDGIKSGANSKKKEVKKSAEDLAKEFREGFDKKIKDLDEKYSYGEISYDSYLEGLNSIKKEYAKYPRFVKDITDKISDVESKYRGDSLKYSKDWISERKHYNELSLYEELKAWERVMDRYEKGTEERKEAEKEVYRLKNDINKKLIDINDDYVSKVKDANQRLIDDEKALNAEYERALEDRYQSHMDYVGIFDQAEMNYEKSGWDLLYNLQSQVDVFKTWGDNLSELSGRNILDDDLIEELRDMGPKVAGEIQALNQLSDEQLEQYALLWKQKSELARATAVDEMTSMKNDTIVKIEELRKETALQLEEYEQEWIKKIEEIKIGVVDQYVGLNASMEDIGENTIKGLMTGLADMEPSLMAQAKAIADRIRATIASALQINSPSRVTTELGEFTGEGLVVGLANTIKDVVSVSKALAMSAKDSLNTFLDGFEVPEVDNEIRVKVVVDSSELDSLKMDTSTIQPDVSYSREAARSVTDSRDNNTQPGNVTTDNSRNFNPVTHIHAGLSPKEIARENERSMRKLAYEFGV